MNPISGLYKLMYWPVCRVYARHVLGDRPANALFRYMVSPQFRRVHGFWPDFITPNRFSEKVWSSLLHDRDPIYTLISDKLLVRDYVAKKVGSEYLIPLLWHGDKPGDIPFDDFPQKFVIKTNHGCGYNIIVKDKLLIDKAKIIPRLKKWLGENYCQDKYLGTEWGYKDIKPTIIVESFIGQSRKAPVDYKFWCFSGRVESISLHFDRFKKHSTKSFNRNFEQGGLRFNLPQYSDEYQRPSNYKEMIKVAESLADGFDFMRVDLYNPDGRILFGELTPYPGGVSAKFDPESVDYALGEKWESKN